MRNLTPEEEDLLDDNGEKADGGVAIEATITELADGGYGLACGSPTGANAWEPLAELFGDRLVRGWCVEYEGHKQMSGMIQIQVDGAEADAIERRNYALRPDAPSMFDGFWSFENE